MVEACQLCALGLTVRTLLAGGGGAAAGAAAGAPALPMAGMPELYAPMLAACWVAVAVELIALLVLTWASLRSYLHAAVLVGPLKEERLFCSPCSSVLGGFAPWPV